MKMDRAFVMMYKTQGQESVLAKLFEVSTRWKENKEKGKTDSPLRVALFKCMMVEMRTRATALLEDKERTRSPSWSTLAGCSSKRDGTSRGCGRPWLNACRRCSQTCLGLSTSEQGQLLLVDLELPAVSNPAGRGEAPCRRARQGPCVDHSRAAEANPHDKGLLLAPIVMDVPEHAVSIQACINHWHEQLALHGLVAGSNMFYLQLRRFLHVPSGRTIRKLGIRLQIEGTIRMPVFDVGLRPQWLPLHVVGGIYHLGNTPHSGHYRSFLSWATREPGNHAGFFTFPGNVMTTDDSVAGRWATPDDAEEICRNVCMLWCGKAPD